MADMWEYLSFFFWYRRLVKLLLHLSTGQCELQRICYKTRHGAQRTCKVGKLNKAKNFDFVSLLNRLLEIRIVFLASNIQFLISFWFVLFCEVITPQKYKI